MTEYVNEKLHQDHIHKTDSFLPGLEFEDTNGNFSENFNNLTEKELLKEVKAVKKKLKFPLIAHVDMVTILLKFIFFSA
jgi:hypothetical protein